MRKFLALVVVLVLVGVAADWIAQRLATDSAEARLMTRGLTGAKVDVGGFPFLDQQGLSLLTLSDAGGGKVGLRREVTVLGRTSVATAQGRVEATGRRLRVTATSIELADGPPVDDGLSQSLGALFSFTYRLRDLPDGMAIRSVEPVTDGFVVRVVGANMTVDVG